MLPFPEVDLLWWALICVVAATESSWGVALAKGAAVSVSPVSLLALPWLADRRRAQLHTLLLGAVGAVALLTLISGGGWWFGERGVWTASVADPRRTLLQWAWFGPWFGLLMVPRAGPLALREAP